MFSRYYFYNCLISSRESAGKRTISGVFKHKSFFKNPKKAKELIMESSLEGYSKAHKAVVTSMNNI